MRSAKSGRRSHQIPPRGTAGVDNKDVYTAEAVSRLPRQRVRSTGRRQVADEADRAQFPRRRRDAIGLSRADRYRCSFRAQCLGNRLA